MSGKTGLTIKSMFDLHGSICRLLYEHGFDVCDNDMRGVWLNDMCSFEVGVDCGVKMVVKIQYREASVKDLIGDKKDRSYCDYSRRMVITDVMNLRDSLPCFPVGLKEEVDYYVRRGMKSDMKKRKYSESGYKGLVDEVNGVNSDLEYDESK